MTFQTGCFLKDVIICIRIYTVYTMCQYFCNFATFHELTVLYNVVLYVTFIYIYTYIIHFQSIIDKRFTVANYRVYTYIYVYIFTYIYNMYIYRIWCFQWVVFLPNVGPQDQGHWVRRGVALLCSLPWTSSVKIFVEHRGELKGTSY